MAAGKNYVRTIGDALELLTRALAEAKSATPSPSLITRDLKSVMSLCGAVVRENTQIKTMTTLADLFGKFGIGFVGQEARTDSATNAKIAARPQFMVTPSAVLRVSLSNGTVLIDPKPMTASEIGDVEWNGVDRLTDQNYKSKIQVSAS